jgi:ankyrin repeat protein
MDPNATFGNQETALHVAVRRNLFLVVTWLLKQGANPTLENTEKLTPLDLARLLRHTKIVRHLEKSSVIWYLSHNSNIQWRSSQRKFCS